MISLIYTTARPLVAKQHIETWLSTAFKPEEVEVVLSVDRNLLPNFTSIGPIRNTRIVVNEDRPCCVDGWNTAIRNAKGDIMVQVSDDLIPNHKWDIKIDERLQHGQICGALGINDSLTASQTFLPHSFITRKVFQQYGYLFHDSYTSMWCDNEYSDTMLQKGYVINANDIVFIHNNGKMHDAVAKQHNSHYDNGKIIYNFRKTVGFERWKYNNYVTSHNNCDEMYCSRLGVRLPYFVIHGQKSSGFYLDCHKLSFNIRTTRYGNQTQFEDLEVLIPTIPNRKGFLDILLMELKRQGVKYIVDDRVGISVGQKRTELMGRATSKYITFIDDDDWIPHDYRTKVEEAISNNDVDVFLYDVMTTVNNEPPRLSVLEVGRQNLNTPEVYFRIANHLMLWKRELAIKFPFPSQNRGEDFIWADKINPHVKTWARIHAILYFYEFLTSNTEAQK